MANGAYGGGTGTAADPYLVEDAADLFAIGTTGPAHYKQTKNIDLKGLQIPVMTIDGVDQFVYDGNRRRIKNMVIHDYPQLSYIGLFSEIYVPATFKNVTMTDSEILFPMPEDYFSMALLVGGCYDRIEFINCRLVNNRVHPSSFGSAGFIGSAYPGDAGALYQKCYVKNLEMITPFDNLTGTAGAIAGFSENSIFDECEVVGLTIEATDVIGAMCGDGSAGFTFINCAARNVSLVGETNVGGYVGLYSAYPDYLYSEIIKADNSYFIGSVKATGVFNEENRGSGPYAGGLVGTLNKTGSLSDEDLLASFTNCFILADIHGVSIDFAGDVVGQYLKISRDIGYPTIRVTTPPPSTMQLVNCFALDTNFGSTEQLAQVASLDQAKLKDTYLVSGWDFDTVWKIRDGKQPPTLRFIDDGYCRHYNLF